jgi:hypothetical protein
MDEKKAARRPNDTRHADTSKPLGSPVAPHVPVEGFQAFPSVRYHADGSSCLVNSQAEHDALDENWAGSPADHK